MPSDIDEATLHVAVGFMARCQVLVRSLPKVTRSGSWATNAWYSLRAMTSRSERFRSARAELGVLKTFILAAPCSEFVETEAPD
jgi:hypothetical protein